MMCMYIPTSGPLTAIKFEPASVASALAINVLLQPGGPYNRIPFGGRMPIRSNASGCYNRWHINDGIKHVSFSLYIYL